MTLITVSSDSTPMYVITATSDIVDNKVAGASYKGKTLYDSEAQVWYIITDDLTLADYILPISGGGGGGGVVSNNGTFLVQDNGANQGAMNETAPASDTASSGINGRLQRVAQNITSLIAKLPTTLGANGGLKIEGVASGTVVPISGTVTADTELPAASALNGTIVKSVSAPVVGAALLVSDNTNLIQPLGDAANGLDVDVTRIPSLVAGTALIGKTATTGKNASTGDIEIDANTVGADGQSNTSNRLKVSDHLNVYNGSTWDRVRSAVTTISSTLTGFLNTLPWGIFNTSPTTRTTGQGGPLETASDGSLRVIPSMAGNDANIETSGSDATSNTQNNLTVTSRGKIYNGSTWDRIREASADALAVTGLQGIANMLWNGATWDRAQSDTTGKQKVSLYGKGSVAGDTALSLITANGQQKITIYDSVGNEVNIGAGLDAASNAINSFYTNSREVLYNSSTWDRMRNNHETTVLASASRSADTNSSDQINYNARGVVITIDLTVLGSTSLTFTVTYKDSLSGKYQTILATTSLVGTGTTSLTIYPSATVTANVSANSPLPRIWRISSVRGGTPGSDTYSISANYIV